LDAKSTKAGGQICVTTINSPYYDGSFSVDDAAHWAGLPNPTARRFSPKRFPDYDHVNTMDLADSAISDSDNFVTFVFQNQ
jgi:hypothetical protein